MMSGATVTTERSMFARGTEARVFIETLFPPEARGFIEIRAKRGPFISQRWHPVGDPPRWGWMLNSLNEWNVWAGVALRHEKGSGARANCRELWSVPVDADCKTAEQAAELTRRLQAFPLAPSMVIRTGSPWSLHLYWCLAGPLRLRGDDGGIRADVEDQYERTVAGLARYFGTDASVSDIARVMRLPGSLNVKPGNGGARVRLIRCHPERRYQFSDFAPWLAPVEDKPAPRLRLATAQDDDDGVDFLAEFTRRGWHIEDQGGGMHYVRCPWVDQHTSESGKSETAIMEPSSPGDGWGFRCWHAHCKERKPRDIYQLFRLDREIEAFTGPDSAKGVR